MKGIWQGKKLSTPRRLLLLGVGGVLLAALVLSGAEAVPRPIDVIVLLEGDVARQRPSHATIWLEGESVIDADARPTESGRLSYRFWLPPRQHELEFSVQGCPPDRRSFDPSEASQLAFSYRCP